MSITTAFTLRGDVTESSPADNATATATKAAIANQSHLAVGVEAQYDAAVSAIKTITLKHGTTTWRTWQWDFANGAFLFSLPVALKGDLNEALSVELEASGTGGVSGVATLWTATD